MSPALVIHVYVGMYSVAISREFCVTSVIITYMCADETLAHRALAELRTVLHVLVLTRVRVCMWAGCRSGRDRQRRQVDKVPCGMGILLTRIEIVLE